MSLMTSITLLAIYYGRILNRTRSIRSSFLNRTEMSGPLFYLLEKVCSLKFILMGFLEFLGIKDEFK